MNWKNISFFPFDGKFSTLERDLDTSSKGFRIDSPQIFTIRIMIISCLRALFGSRFFINFCSVILRKRDVRKTVICFFFERTSRKFASTADYSPLFSRKIVEGIIFLFEIISVIIIMVELMELVNW